MNALPNIRWQRLKNIFSEVCELSPEARRQYLSLLRLDEKTLYEEVVELIGADEEAQDFLRNQISLDLDHSRTGETVGRYKILSEIGRGGMGAIFEAERTDGEFDQKVAIKLTNRSLFSDELVKRFIKERQILAKLEHPNIVRLLDGGVTVNQTPYYVMEFIEGTSITTYCEENGLDVLQKLQLFLQICRAVSYAHRRLIVHRDLKPSNILVTNEGQVKLLDFGIAKILDPGTDVQTQTQHAPMTPEYASPEQIKGEIITTSSDVYALGIVLYELLTGKTPKEIYGVSAIELSRGVCEIEPGRPSSTLTSAADPSRIDGKTLKGDLDNIILKALRKEPEHRYSTVEQFAEDIKAYINGFPVKAHPPSLTYRIQKFARRQRPLVLLASVSAILIASGAILAIYNYVNAQHQRQVAEENFKQVRKIANSLILEYHDEIAKLEGSTKLREKLVNDAVIYLDAVSQEDTDDPQLLKEIAIAYRKIGAVQGMPFAANLGKTGEAVKNYEKSVGLLEKARHFAPGDFSIKDELKKSYNEMAQAITRTGVDAQDIYRKALKVSEELIENDPNNIEGRVYHLRLKMHISDLHNSDLDNLAEYKSLVDEAAEINKIYPGNIGIIAVLAIINERIGNLYRGMGNKIENAPGREDEAKELYEQSVVFSEQSLNYMQIRQSLDPTDGNNRRRLFVANSNLAAAMGYLGRLDEAEHYQTIAENLLKELKEKDPNNKETVLDDISAIKNRFNILEKRGKFGPAFQKAKSAIEALKEYCKSDPQNSESLGWLGLFYNKVIRLLEKQNKKIEAQSYRLILQELMVDYRKKFDKVEVFDNDGGR